MLFLREIKKVVFSVAFMVFIIAFFAMAVSQDILDFSNEKIEMPQPGQNYGMHDKEIPEIIMPAALNSLYSEFSGNSYTTYPIGFYKNVKLSDNKHHQIAQILSLLTGEKADDLIKSDSVQEYSISFDSVDINGTGLQGNNGNFSMTSPNIMSESHSNQSVKLKENITYEEFKQHMSKADEIIGGGSDYSESNLITFGKVPITYEEALAQYELSMNTDHFTGAYARLFCDYLGVEISVFPVFLAVAISLKDKRAKMNELIYTRKSSSLKITVTRYLAIITAVMIPAIIISYISNASAWHLYNGMQIDYLAPLKYCIGWLLPSAMISSAVGLFFTELTGTPIAIFIQGFWGFIDVFTGVADISGNYSLFGLVPRHNTLLNTQTFIDEFGSLAANRILFTVLSLILLAVTVIIYELKRRGKINGFEKIKTIITALANSKKKSKA